MSNLIGQSLGRYHILEQLGEGGMAVVYKANDTRLETDVAVKIIRTEKLTLENMDRTLKRFEREAKALAKLTHQNIVKVTDYGEYEGKPYLVMPYLPGGTLKLKLGKPMPWQDAVHLLAPVARALEYAHEHNIIHRDVKPSNILLTEKGQPMLSDFGIARVIGEDATLDLTGTRGTVGTPEYSSPEQGLGKAIDHRTDIYSLGIVLYELVTGRKPFQGDTPMEIAFKHYSEPLPQPRKFVKDLPQPVEQVLVKALAKEPKDRYPNMGAFAEAMEGLLEGKVAKRTSLFKPAVLKRQPKTESPQARSSVPKPIQTKSPSYIWIWGIAAVVVVGLAIMALQSLFKSIPAAVIASPISSNIAVPSKAPPLSYTSNPIDRVTATPILSVTATPSLGIGSNWTRPSDKMVMVYVPAGDFAMGSNAGADNEKPEHQVYLDAYWIDRTEVTDAMYALCVSAGACKDPASSGVSSSYADQPVSNTLWDDAESYCSWAGASLPTEAQWEKAARGTDGRIYPWGNDKDPTRFYLILLNQGPMPVGSFPSGASPYGALDMAGSVFEWVADWYSPTYYSSSPTSNPTGPASGTNHVIRGGTRNWVRTTGGLGPQIAYDYRSVARSNIASPGYGLNGFRCARNISP